MRHSALLIAVAVGTLMAAPVVMAQYANSGTISSGGIPAQSRMPLGTTPADIKIEGSSFARKMAISDLFEIESSNLALDRSNNNEVKAFARTIAQNHAQSTAKLKDAYMKSAISDPLPNKLDQEHAQEMARLRGLPDAEFDYAYMLAQVEDHQQAINLLQTYSLKGDNPLLRMFATEALPTVQMHLGDAQRLATPMNAAR